MNDNIFYFIILGIAVSIITICFFHFIENRKKSRKFISGYDMSQEEIDELNKIKWYQTVSQQIKKVFKGIKIEHKLSF